MTATEARELIAQNEKEISSLRLEKLRKFQEAVEELSSLGNDDDYFIYVDRTRDSFAKALLLLTDMIDSLNSTQENFEKVAKHADENW